MNLNMVTSINKFVIKNIFPQLTIIFDISPDIVQKRLNKNELDRMELLGLEFQNKVREGYMEISKTNDRYHIIRCKNKTINQIHLEVIKLYNSYIKDKKLWKKYF